MNGRCLVQALIEAVTMLCAYSVHCCLLQQITISWPAGSLEAHGGELEELRSKVTDLQATVQRGCIERASLQQEISRLESRAPQNMLGSIAPALQKQSSLKQSSASPVMWGMARPKPVKPQLSMESLHVAARTTT